MVDFFGLIFFGHKSEWGFDQHRSMFLVEGLSLFVFFIFGLTVHEFDSVFLAVHDFEEKLYIIKILHGKISDSVSIVDFGFLEVGVVLGNFLFGVFLLGLLLFLRYFFYWLEFRCLRITINKLRLGL